MKNNPKIHFSSIQKRNGNIVSFDEQKISTSIFNALQSFKEDQKLANELTSKVVQELRKNDFRKSEKISVVDVVDTVLIILIDNNHSDVARDFIKYRSERRKFIESKILQEPIFEQHKKTLDVFLVY